MTALTIDEAVAKAEALILAAVNDGAERPFDHCIFLMWATCKELSAGDWSDNDSAHIGIRVAEISMHWGTQGKPPYGTCTWHQQNPSSFPVIFAAERYILDLVRESSNPDEIVDTEYWLTQAVKDARE